MDPKEMTHRQLADELALVKTMSLVEVPLGRMWEERNRVPRADVLEVKPRYEDFVVTIYDVKRTRTDLLKSLREEKWKKYLPHCHRFYFACVKGIVHKRDLPTGVGLTLRNENGWYTPEAAAFRDLEIPLDTMKSIMFQRVKRELTDRRRERIVQNVRIRGRSKELGQQINDALQFTHRWKWQIEKLKKEGLI